MNKRIYALAVAGAAVICGAAAAGAISHAADATERTPAACTVPTAYYVNSDETARAPQKTPYGLKFSPTDLIHIAVSLDVADLHPGTYQAYPQPDQDSFFSVEVNGPDGKYGTLRWNAVQHYWEATSQGMQHNDVDPAALADSFPLHLSHHVGTIGVGYTLNPPGTKTVTVSSVRFGRKTYDLRCHPAHTASPSPSVSTTSASPTPSASVSHSATASPSQSAGGVVTTSSSTPGSGALAVTGAPTGLIAAGAAVLLLIGAGTFWLTRRRRTTFTA